MKKQKETANNNEITKLVFDCQTKDAASEFMDDVIKSGVPAESCKIRKVSKTDIFRLTVTNDNEEIQAIVKMLLSEERGYGLSLEEIQEFLNIKFVI